MNLRLLLPTAWLVALTLIAPTTSAQMPARSAHIGYAFPAGGCRGTRFEVTLGGQFLTGSSEVIVSGSGVDAKVIKLVKPLTNKQVNVLREKLKQARDMAAAARGKGRKKGNKPGYASVLAYAKELGVTPEQIAAVNEYRKQKSDPKRQLNPQLAERLTIQVTIADNAVPGRRELRVATATGLTNPVWFDVGSLPESLETEPNDKDTATGVNRKIPFVLNGQIMPGDVDRFRFHARRHDRLVIAVGARDLIPYLADAVPGWFQAALALYDSDGHELAFVDDFQFHPDPVLSFNIPSDGDYVLEIRDAIYRGREDFVYRISVGEFPFVTSVFPLGCQAGTTATMELTGWNQGLARFSYDASDREPGIYHAAIPGQKHEFNQVKLAVDTLPDGFDREPNDSAENAQAVQAPIVVNGRIDRPGDQDVFRFTGREGGQVIVEVAGRRLNSPIDSLLRVTDERGTVLALNDDADDKGEGLITHHADSRILLKLPEDGDYYVYLTDAQAKGGPEYAYRLRVSARQPDFALRISPSTINGRPGGVTPITVYALRKDGFQGDISIQLKNPGFGFQLSGNVVPSGEDHVRMTLTAPRTVTNEPMKLNFEGQAQLGGRAIVRTAVSADDMMQAFIYHHLVPAQNTVAWIGGASRFKGLTTWRAKQRKTVPLRSFGDKPVKLVLGQTTEVPLVQARSSIIDRLELTLNDGPEGITVSKGVTDSGSVVVRVTTDEKRVAPGLRGNLMIDVRATPVSTTSKSRSAARAPIAHLPAIPFQVVNAKSAPPSL